MVATRWYQETGVIVTELQPQVEKLGADPRVISVGVSWSEDGWCLGEFEARATETASQVRVAMIHRQFTHNVNCAGLGTEYNRAWADVRLTEPLGSRPVVRSSDGAQLLVLGQLDRFMPKDPVSAVIQQFGGLNDSPPLALKKEARISNSNALRGLAMQLDSLPPVPRGTINCPFDDGSHYLIELDYAVRGNVSLKIDARGCQNVHLDGSQKAIVSASGSTIFVTLTSLLGK